MKRWISFGRILSTRDLWKHSKKAIIKLNEIIIIHVGDGKISRSAVLHIFHKTSRQFHFFPRFAFFSPRFEF